MNGSTTLNQYDGLSRKQIARNLERNVPAQVQHVRAFVVFKYKPPRTPESKRGKVPYYAKGAFRARRGQHGTQQDLANMATFTEALAVLQERDGVAGVGVCALPGNSVTFLDVDNCFDPNSGELNALAAELLGWDTYTELSPSGQGLRLIVDGNLGIDAKNHDAGLEVFSCKGFVTLTGQIFGGQKRPVRALSDDQVARLRVLVGKTAQRPDATDAPDELRNIPSPLTADRLLEVRKALKAIDPDIGYAEWIKVGQALHSGDPDPTGKGFKLWLRWSQRGDKFAGTSEEELATKWAGFGAGRGTTLGTLFHIAQQHGYEPKSNNAAPVADANEGLNIVSAADIPMRKVRWLWEGRIPYGMLTLFAGEGGVGKGTVAAHVVACATAALPWPDHDEVLGEILGPKGREPIDVLWFGVEDAPDSVIIPRCIAAGAVRARLYFEQGVRAEGETAQFSFADDLQRLETELRRRSNVKLVIFDPITAYLSSRRKYARAVDSHNATDLRGLLSPLSALAARTGVALVGITHLTKATERGFVARVLGSGAWTQVARKVHAFCAIPTTGATDAPAEYAMLDVKRNIGTLSTPLRYHIVGGIAEAGPRDERNVRTSRVEWDGADSTLTVEQLTGRSRGPLPTVRNLAAEWLRNRLRGGPIAAETIKAEARVAGISDHTLRNARIEVCEISTGARGVTVYRLRGRQ